MNQPSKPSSSHRTHSAHAAQTSRAPRALLSVSDKAGIVEFANALAVHGFELVSTGGTAHLLRQSGLKVRDVSAVTGFPEILDGRVKTLHPAVHAGLLARPTPEHQAALDAQGIARFDLLVINLYPFTQTIANPACTLEQAIENIDIGGPAMLRAAAKNYEQMTVLTETHDYATVLHELEHGGVTLETRYRLAVKAFAHTARYDAAISTYLGSLPPQAAQHPERVPERQPFAQDLFVHGRLAQSLRYGENPHQQAAWYRDEAVPDGVLSGARQWQGKELSFNNIADADAAWNCVRMFDAPACVIVKHANPCGVAVAESALAAYAKAFKTDPTSAFGGIIAFNVAVDAAAAQAMLHQFVEVVLAPAFDDEARHLLASKANVRVLQVQGFVLGSPAPQAMEAKRVGGGWLVQSSDVHTLIREDIRVVTAKQPTPAQLDDLLFAWRVAQHVKSNAIVFCAGGMTLGIGAGQMSRIDSARIAAIKAEHAGLSLRGSAVASDAFFPFRDGLDVVAEAGAQAVIQPGGSIRDDEVIRAANERGLVMAFTGVRHFRH